jgi:hypothetical protein
MGYVSPGRVQVSLELDTEDYERLKDIAKLQMRSLAREMAFRLRRSLVEDHK